MGHQFETKNFIITSYSAMGQSEGKSLVMEQIAKRVDYNPPLL